MLSATGAGVLSIDLAHQARRLSGRGRGNFDEISDCPDAGAVGLRRQRMMYLMFPVGRARLVDLQRVAVGESDIGVGAVRRDAGDFADRVALGIV